MLAAGEVAGAVLLLAGAGLLVRTLASMNAEDPGYHADSVLTMSVNLPLQPISPIRRRVLTFFRQADAALAAIPGVQSVGFVDNLPLDGWDIGQPVEIVGDPPTEAVQPQIRALPDHQPPILRDDRNPPREWPRVHRSATSPARRRSAS